MKIIFFFLSLILQSSAMAFTVMAYNTENLFDAHHDVGKEDFTFLPLGLKRASKDIQAYCKTQSKISWIDSCLNFNWDNEAFYKKAFNLASVIKKFKSGTDIIILEEVENIKAINVLTDIALEGFGYTSKVLIEGPDVRGIDVAIISKYPLISSKLHNVELSGRPTRGILEAIFEIQGKRVAVLANHWPSQGNSTEARISAAQAFLEISKLINADIIIAGGDFNTLANEVPNPLNILKGAGFIDIEEKARQVKMFLNPGTHWYKGEWSSLDKFFVKIINKKHIAINFESYDILNFNELMEKKEWFNQDEQIIEVHQIPKRFETKTYQGYSDHLPIVMEIKTL